MAPVGPDTWTFEPPKTAATMPATTAVTRPAAAPTPELMPNAVEELLRFTTPVEYGTARYAKEAVVVGDVTVAAGDLVIALQASANRDETAFARADQLDITRASTRHLAFGAGIHTCAGSSLAQLEAELVFAALARRFPELRVVSALRQESILVRGLTQLLLDCGYGHEKDPVTTPVAAKDHETRRIPASAGRCFAANSPVTGECFERSK